MKLYRHLNQLNNAFPQGSALTIGNFDGVHLGHQAVLAHLKQEARKRHLPTVVMLFEPQPNEYFSKENAPARLMRLREKLYALKQVGIDAVVRVKFNQTFAHTSAENFIKEILVKKLNVKFLSIGDDFRFGAKRQGDFALLKKVAPQYGFCVEKNPTFQQDNQRISSTTIRQCLKEGKLALAEKQLSKPFCIQGRVIHGKKLGRTIGIPTANIRIHRQVCPIQGVFAVNVRLCNGEMYHAVANIGTRPSVKGGTPLLEVHLLDFNGDLYGQTLDVIFHKKLRDEQKFPNLDALKVQIRQDIQQTKNYFG